MKKEIIEIDKEKGIYRITTTDERWYTLEEKDETTGLPSLNFRPNVTWITGYVYKGIEFYKWLASRGWDEAEVIKTEAGDKGSKVHNATGNLINGLVVKMTDKYLNNSTGLEEELKADEYEAIISFATWFNKIKPEILLRELVVISKIHNYAGTVDLVIKIEDQVWIIDIKTSQSIWPSTEAQVSAYKQALKEMGRNVKDVKLAILQLGYRKNKNKYKFTEIEDKFEKLFLPALSFWKDANEGKSPKQIELPLEIKLELPKKEEVPSKKELKIDMSVKKSNNKKK